MARRFTDTEKWKDEWYGSLSNDNRIIWQYLLDNCTQAGIFKKDWRLLRFQCNTQISEEDFLKVFGDRVIDRGNYFFIPKFLKFQNKKGLNSNKPAVVSIREELIENNLIEIVRQSLGNDFITIKGIGKGKGKEEGMDKGKGSEPAPSEPMPYHPITAEALDLIDALCEYFAVRPVTSSIIYNTISEYVAAVANRGELKIASMALQNYISYKKLSGEQRHNINSWIGSMEAHFKDGQWILIDWEAKLKSVKSNGSINGKSKVSLEDVLKHGHG